MVRNVGRLCMASDFRSSRNPRTNTALGSIKEKKKNVLPHGSLVLRVQTHVLGALTPMHPRKKPGDDLERHPSLSVHAIRHTRYRVRGQALL